MLIVYLKQLRNRHTGVCLHQDPAALPHCFCFLIVRLFLCSQAFSANSSFVSFPPEHNCTSHLAIRHVDSPHFVLRSSPISFRSHHPLEVYSCFIIAELRYASPLISSPPQIYCAPLRKSLTTSSLFPACSTQPLLIQAGNSITSSIQPCSIDFVAIKSMGRFISILVQYVCYSIRKYIQQ